MPVAPTYPGVYIEEVPSGVRTIVGVATSITAFIGRAARGPTNRAVRIQSFADFERTFGGLHRDSMMSYAVSHFFGNGGSDALVVRVVNTVASSGAVAKAATMNAHGLALTALSAGEWGNQIRARVENAPSPPSTAEDPLFNLTVKDMATGAQEVFHNLSLKPTNKRYVQSVLADGSNLVRVSGSVPTTPPTAHSELKSGDPFVDVFSDAALVKAVVTLPAPNSENLKLEVKQPGAKGNELTVKVTHDPKDGAKFTLQIKGGDQEPKDLTVSITPDAADFVKTKIETELGGLLSVLDVPARRPNETPSPVPAKDGSDFAVIVIGTGASQIQLKAKKDGSAGRRLRARIDLSGISASEKEKLNLYIEDAATGKSESFLGIAITDLKAEVSKTSTLVDVVTAPSAPGARPEMKDFYTQASGGEDGGIPNETTDVVGSGNAPKTGMHVLEDVDLFNLLCIPPMERGGDTSVATWTAALKFCAEERAVLLVDSPSAWDTIADARQNVDTALRSSLGSDLPNGAVYFPRLKMADPLKQNRTDDFVPCGAVAGMIARTDARRGVWKAPAGIEAALGGVRGFTVPMTDGENGQLNPLGINCLRNFRDYGNVIWGARTLAGSDQRASEWKYLPVRRLALFIEESLYRGTHWVVFEPNDEPLWGQIRLNVGAFLQGLFRQGAFKGRNAREAYFVQCDASTTTQIHINQGIVNIHVGFAPLKPAEFVILKIQQIAGRIET